MALALRAALFRRFIALALVLLAVQVHASQPAPEPAVARYEVKFLQDMIDHHAMAVEMAETCESKAVHEELAELCSEIRTAQQQEIEAMQAWLQDWYGLAYDPQMSRGDMRAMERLASLSGADYEIAFMETMIRHHASAIREGSRCLERASHSELLDLCENIIVTQSMEIQLMRAWLCDWYGLCGTEE